MDQQQQFMMWKYKQCFVWLYMYTSISLKDFRLVVPTDHYRKIQIVFPLVSNQSWITWEINHVIFIIIKVPRHKYILNYLVIVARRLNLLLILSEAVPVGNYSCKLFDESFNK